MRSDGTATKPSIVGNWSAGWLAMLLLAFSPMDGHGEESLSAGQGHLKTVANGPAPQPGTRIVIEPSPADAEAGDDPLYIVASRLIARELAARALRMSDAADLTLDIRIDFTSFHVRPPRSPGNITGQPSKSRDSEDRLTVEHQVEIPIDRERSSRPAMVAIALTLFKPGATPIWSATVRAADHADQRERLVGRLVKAAMRDFGATAERDFVLTCDGTPSGDDGLCLQ